MSLANPSDTSNRPDPSWDPTPRGSTGEHTQSRVASWETTPRGSAGGRRPNGPYSGQAPTDPSIRVSGAMLTDPSTRVSGR